MAPGEGCAVALVGLALAADVVLIRRGHLPISTCVRGRRIARVAVIGLAAHLLFAIPGDPLAWLGSKVCPKETT